MLGKKLIMILGSSLVVILISVGLIGTKRMVNASQMVEVQKCSMDIKKMYDSIQEEEKYVVTTIGNLMNTEIELSDWRKCLEYIEKNYDKIDETNIDMDKVNSYKEAYESVKRLESKRVNRCIDKNRNNIDINAELAKQYMEKWWNSNNPEFIYYDGKDCANFASQCLMVAGHEMDNTWNCYNRFDPTIPWIRAQSFREYWEEKVEYEYFTADDIVYNYGDIVMYGDEIDAISLLNENGRAFHIMLVYNKADDLLLAGHTNNRLEYSMKNLKDYNIVIHKTSMK